MIKFIKNIIIKTCGIKNIDRMVDYINFFKHKTKSNIYYFSLYDRLKMTYFYIKSPKTDPIKLKYPWTTYHASIVISQITKHKSKIFEYGSGASTLFFRKISNYVISIEHDYEWFYKLSNILTDKKNHKLLFIPPKLNEITNNISLNDYVSSDQKYSNLNFYDYITSIDNFPDNFFDIIFVDGRCRNMAIKHSIPKLKKNGYLIIDDSERNEYFHGINKKNINGNFKLIINSYTNRLYLNNLGETSIYIKL